MSISLNISEELWFEASGDTQADEKAKESLAASVAKLQGMKPFPVVVRRLLRLMQDPDFRIQDVVSSIEEDPSLALSVLRAANSALFSMAGPSQSIRQAVVRLGVRTLREVVVTVTVSGLFHDVGGIGRSFRDHCSRTAIIARVLAREFTPAFTEGILLAGLLHDMGKLMLMQVGEFQYDSAQYDPDQHHIDEREALGFDHAILGGLILAHWKVPEPIPKAVAWHHQPARAYQDNAFSPLVAILRSADQIEPILRYKPDRFEESMAEFAQSVDFQYAGIDVERLKKMVDKLFQASKDSEGIFGG
jgi:putative nucleotidyltransferase with HDIG domain